MLLEFFQSDPLAKSWFRKPDASPLAR